MGDLDLMVDEIAANALRYTAGKRSDGGVRMAVLSSADRVRVEITDDGGAATLPVVKVAASDAWAESGRGPAMVSALSDCWGFEVGGTVAAAWRLGGHLKPKLFPGTFSSGRE